MATSLNASLNVQLNTQSLNQASKQVSQALGRITGQASEFQKSLDASTARVFAFGATTAVLNGVNQSFKKLVATTIEVEKRLVEVNSIFQATEQTFNRFRNSIFRVAKETGQSFSTVADGAAELARQGLSAEETASRLKSALVLTRISGLDAEKSVKALTAAINGFQSAGLKHTEIVNKMVAVDTAFAVSAQDLAEAFSRAGSTAEDAGVSFDQLLALVTAVEQKTARGGAVIGNAFKSIFTRLARGTTISQLQELGVQIDATQTGVQKLQALSTAIEGISDPTVVSQIKELAGGVFQINVVSAALKDLSSETGIFKDAAKVAAAATNEAFEKNAALGETLASNINELVVGLTSLAEKVGTITFGPLLQNLVGIATTFTEFLDKALDPEKGNTFIKGFFKAIGSFLGGPAIVIFTAAFAKISQLIGRFAIEGLKSLFTIGTQTEKIRSVEASIVQLLQRDESLRNAILSSTMSQAQKEQAVLAAIKNENALLQQQAVIMRQIATMAHARGVRGTPAGGFKGRFNAGFRAEEAEARMLGAPAGVKARMSKGTIGGRKFIMNNHETEIPNFAGRDSAVIPHYSRGFVPNYLDLDTVGKRSRSQFFDAQGNPKTNKVRDAIAKPNSRLGAALIAKRDAGGEVQRLKLSGTGKAMLVPRLNFEGRLKKGSTGRFMKGKQSIPYILASGVPIRGPKIPRSVDSISDPQDEQLRSNMLKSVVSNAKAFANTLYPVTGRGVSDSKIKRQLLKQGGGKGALHAIIGAGFEAAVMAGLNLSPAKKKDGGDFDVREERVNNLKDIQGLFGLGTSVKLMDFKATASAGGRASFVKKIANEKYKNNTGLMLKALGRTNKAAGYIPNFSRGRGVPMSLMRVHKDDKGSPVAVTNLRDEPNGLQDAIKRERQGIGMHAGGFVPNYDKSMGLVAGMMGLQFAMGMLQSKVEKSLFQAEEEQQKKAEEIKNSKLSVTEKIKETRKLKDNVRAVEESTRSLQDFSETMMAVMSAMMAMSMLNSMTGGGIGRLGGRAMGRLGFGAAARKKAAFGFRGTARQRGLDRAGQMDFVRQQMGKRAIARGTGVAGIALGGGLLVSDLMSQTKTKREREASMMSHGGGLLGGIATGAAIGTMGGGPIGTLVGGIIGGVAGGLLGDKFAKRHLEGETTFAKVEGDQLGGLSRKEFSERADLMGKLRARGVTGLEYDLASTEERKKMLELDETEEGVENVNKALTEYQEALDKLVKIEKGIGIRGKKREQALIEQRLVMEKKRNVLLGKAFEHESDNVFFLNELKFTTQKLAKARSDLAEKLKQTGVHRDEEALARATSDLDAFTKLSAMSGVLTGTKHEAAAKAMMGGGQALAQANQLAAEKKEAQGKVDLARQLGISDTGGIAGRTMAQLNEVIAASGKELQNSVRKGAVFFKTTMHNIAKEQERVQSQLNEVSLSIISKAQDVIKARVAGELPDLGALGRDTSTIGGFLKAYEQGVISDKKDPMRMEELRNMLAELDTSALGISEAQAIAAAMGRPLEDIASILNQLKLDTIMSPLQREAATTMEATPAQKAQLRLYEAIKAKSDEEIKQQQNLIEKRDGLSLAMENLTKMYNSLASLGVTDEQGRNVVEEMSAFADALSGAGSGLAGLEEFGRKFTDSTIKTTELITSVNTLNSEAIVVIRDLNAVVKNLSDDVARMRSQYQGK